MLALLLSAGPAGSQGASDVSAIRAARAASNEAIARHDAEAIVSRFDSEYQITTSLGQMSQGADGEIESWKRLFSQRPDVVYVRTPEDVEVSRKYPLASEAGTWLGTWTTGEGPVRTGGNFMAMWRKVDGEWKIRAELFVALYCNGGGCP